MPMGCAARATCWCASSQSSKTPRSTSRRRSIRASCSVRRGRRTSVAPPPAHVNILSIQSHVAYGHVGNSAAVFPMQRLGHEVWPIHTVQFSNHTGYGAWRGEVLPASIIDECVEGIAERGVLASCDGVLSGYMGSADTGEAILRAVQRVKAANPQALYCCDPVIGDFGRGVLVREGVDQLNVSGAMHASDY